MGLASSQVTLLMLTARKADCEYDIAIASNRKMALARESSNLSQEYYQRINTKDLAYYSNGSYYDVSYEYLMGYGTQYDFALDGSWPLKNNNKTVLTDYRGLVVLSDKYAEMLTKAGVPNDGSSFSATDFVPKVLSNLTGLSEELCRKLYEGKELTDGDVPAQDAQKIKSPTGEVQGDSSISIAAVVESLYRPYVDFYKPIFQAAATNGWTTEYNAQIDSNKEYVGDAITSGIFQLADVTDNGSYYECTELSYYITKGLVQEVNDADNREEVNAWYQAEKAIINEKETALDLHITELSAELEAIKTEMDSIKTFIDDAIGTVFDWGQG